MRTLRSVLFISIVLILALNSGCKEVTFDEWHYDFTDKLDDSDWHVDPTYSGTHEVVFGQGLLLNDAHLVTPVAFTGDFTMEVQFSLNVLNDTGIFMTFSIADEQDWEADNYVFATLDSIGWSGHEEWVVKEKGAMGSNYPIEENGSIPNLDWHGLNTWKVVKTGNNFEFFLDGVSYGSFDSAYCRGSKYYLKLHCAAFLGGGTVYFKDVLVTYSGDAI